MTKKSDSQTQQDSRNEPKNDPFAFMSAGFDTWAQMAEKATRENIDRIQGLYDELADIENAAYDRAKKGAQDLGDMMNESMTYMAELGREWRKLTLDATRRSAQMFGTRS